jgi:DNA gyrase subunit A
MGERTGVGLAECAILEALEALGAQPGRGYRTNARVLARVEDLIGLAPAYAYEVLLDLARPWMMPVSLIQGQGNIGSRGNDPAANPPYTGSRLSAAGQVALAAERGDIAPVPIGLINGNVYARGTRPPFRPQAVIDALRPVIQRPRVTSNELTGIIGAPYFLNGCTVTGDFAALAAGRPAILRLEARVSISEDEGSVRIENFPPNANPDETAQSLASRASVREWAADHPGLHQRAQLALSDLRDESSGQHGDLLVCVPARGTTPGQLRDQLRDIYGVYTTIPVALPRPLPALLRSWARAYPAEDLLASLAALEDAIRVQPARG